MQPRINVFDKGRSAMKAMYGLGAYLSKSPVEQALLNLIYFRVSQINGCAYCLDMHSKDLCANGEKEQRLFLLNAWKESPFYSDRERAALAWAEALTQIKSGLVADDIYIQAQQHFSEQELIDLTIAVITINGYNRVNIAFGAHVGDYQPGAFAH